LRNCRQIVSFVVVCECILSMLFVVSAGVREQLLLPFPRRRGGQRAGAGRKRGAGRRSTPHRTRPQHRRYEPVLVTWRCAVRSLRSEFVFPTLRNAIADLNERWRGRFRIVVFSVQADHLHFIVEAEDRRALSGGLRGFAVSFARRFNRLVFRRGAVFAGRWHGRALATPRAVRYALTYVLANARKHGEAVGSLDPFSSAPYFRGFRQCRDHAPVELRPTLVPRGFGPSPSAAAESWLLCRGWSRGGLLSIHDAPSRKGRTLAAAGVATAAK
jgi:REP element-mobilizing transposase RayT